MRNRSNLLIRLFGYPATLIHGDTLVLDRWLWLKKKFTKEPRGGKLLDVGCGTGAFTMGMSRMGYESLGLTWDEADTNKARERAAILKIPHCEFSIQDVRKLDERKEFLGQFDYAICTENIEHIMNDQKLMIDMSNCLKKCGKLFLTTPNINFIPMTDEDKIGIETEENGGHVRRGYSKEDFERLCAVSNLKILEIGFVSGYSSQKITKVFRRISEVSPVLGYGVTFPFRFIPPLVDSWIPYTGYSITLIAQKI